MYVQQRVQTALPHTKSKRIGGLALLFIASLLLAVTLSLSANIGTAHAATSTSIKPATSGGGCRSNSYFEACISVNSAGEVEPDVYILYSDMCSIYIDLYRDNALYTQDHDNNCYAKGTHLYGFGVEAVSGYNWQTVVWGYPKGGSETSIASPYQYT